MNNQSQSLLSTLQQDQAVVEISNGTALEKMKAAEAVLIDVTSRVILEVLEEAGDQGATSSELTYMAVIKGNTELTDRPLMQAAFNGFFKDLFARAINKLSVRGFIMSEKIEEKQKYKCNSLINKSNVQKPQNSLSRG